MPSGDFAASDSVLSPARILEAMRLLARSSAASFWQKQFVEWITEEPELASIGARGLVELCAQGEPSIVKRGNAALDAIDSAMQDADLPEPLRETLARARQAIQGAVEDDFQRGEAR